MIFPQVFKKPPLNEKGIALFIVIAAISVLAILVTDFTYIANINQSIAFGKLDQIKAHYLAKSALKIGLLRLKIYFKAKDLPVSSPQIKKAIEKIWKEEVQFPVSDIFLQQLSPVQRDEIKKFQENLDLEGFFNLKIISESSKYNLNSLAYGPENHTDDKNQSPDLNHHEKAREGIKERIKNILSRLFENDQELADRQSNLNISDLVNEISLWTNPSRQTYDISNRSSIPMKGAPFYDISELHMIPSMNDELFHLLAPHFRTDSSHSEININELNPDSLQALIPKITNEELNNFFKYVKEEKNPLFDTADSFYKYLQEHIGSLQAQNSIENFKKNLNDKNITLTKDHTLFKIIIEAYVNQSKCTLEAWVKVHSKNQTTSPPNPNQNSSPPQNMNTTNKLQIILMRFS